MKKLDMKIMLLVLSLVLGARSFSQERFNKVIDCEREAMHLLANVIPIDDGYLLVVGTDGIDDFVYNRCTMLAKIDLEGNLRYRNFICDSTYDVYEGRYSSKMVYQASDSTYKCVLEALWHKVIVCDLDENLTITRREDIINDSIQSIMDILPIENSIYFVGQKYYNGYRGYIEKRDLYGNVLNSISLPENFAYQAAIGNINTTKDGNLITLGNASQDGMQKLLVKLDTSLNIIWQRIFGRSGWNNGSEPFLFPSPDSSYVMSGMYPVCSGNSAQCVRKIDDSGNLLWEKVIKNYACYPAMIMENAYDVYVDEDGYIYMIGTGSTHNYLYTGFLLKLSPRGDIMYRRDYLPMGIVTRFENYLTSIKPTPDGGFILGGYTYDDYFGELFNDYYQQPWLVKTDHDGLDGLCYTELPELTLDVFIPDTVCNMDTIDCVVNISGPSAPYTLEFGTGQVIDSIYYPDIFVPITFGIDTILSGENMYNYTEPIVEATLKDSTSGFIIARHYNIATPTLPGEQQLAITLTDYYGNTKTIYKDIYVNACHEVEVDDNENVVLSVYPNPARENIMVDGENIAGIQICNLLGGVVYEMQQCNGNNIISTENMPAGSYFVRVRMADGKVVTKKIVVM